mgnify:CR=1 FL=1
MHTKSICKTAAIVLMTVSCTQNKTYIDTIGVEVSAEENREYSYTDKKSGYWYGTTHQDELQWYSGWNIAKKRILADYTISLDGEALDRSEAECTVYPDRLVRRWDNAVETFRMVDDLPIIHISVEAEDKMVSISLDHSLLEHDSYMKGSGNFFGVRTEGSNHDYANVDHIDFYLLHSLHGERFDEKILKFNTIEKMKAEAELKTISVFS